MAQNVLLGKTKGYRHHPQLIRFKNTGNPTGAISSYLRTILTEAEKRGYSFNRKKIADTKINSRIPVTSGQVEYEFKHLKGKLKKRAPHSYKQLITVHKIKVNPIFIKVDGLVEDWEII